MTMLGFGKPSPNQVLREMMKLRKELTRLPYDLSELKKENEAEYNSVLAVAETIYKMAVESLKGGFSEKGRILCNSIKTEIMGY